MTARESGRPEHYFDAKVVADYDRRYRGGWGRWKHRRKLAQLRRWLAPSEPVLEVACGPGRLDAAFDDATSIHVDLSPEMLARYRRQNPSARLVRADASHLPFSDGAFDAVVSIRFVSHLRGEYRRRVLAELARVSRDRVIIDGRHLYNLRYWSRWFRRRLGLARADKLRHTFAEFEQELRECGLELVARRSIAWGLSGRVLLMSKVLPRSVDAPAPPPTRVETTR
ncbi:MAG: class I SAM-dependent methyltransferase [Planctomycetes bacterium]|nr:class I SAM-dependent methyltransferase [Planctomycetota bacterium]